MIQRAHRIARKLYPLLAAGVLLQTTGCDTGVLTSQLATLVVQNLIASYVYGSFNLTTF
ncbi:MAG: hypothetical protein HY287_12355 [Planctomycetes bacterium]|nr:hypothetical protein [Planctomycetota bacterium]